APAPDQQPFVAVDFQRIGGFARDLVRTAGDGHQPLRVESVAGASVRVVVPPVIALDTLLAAEYARKAKGGTRGGELARIVRPAHVRLAWPRALARRLRQRSAQRQLVPVGAEHRPPVRVAAVRLPATLVVDMVLETAARRTGAEQASE